MTPTEPVRAKEGPRQPHTAGQTVSQPPKSDHNDAIRLLAHERLEQLFREATASRFYGRVMVEVNFVNGRAETVHRRIEGVDK